MGKIIVTEYPKSGGSWLTSLLGDVLGVVKRDIYVNKNFHLFDVSKHPWYCHTNDFGIADDCVIKSHELPDSPLINFEAQFIHLVRDGRDVVVSKYFYEKDFCVKNGISDSFDTHFDDFVQKTAAEWRDYIMAWESKSKIYHYEELLDDTFAVLQKILVGFGYTVPGKNIRQSIENNTKAKFSESLSRAYKYNTFVRKGMAGDWLNYFSERNLSDFQEVAGDVLGEMGYV